MYCVVKSLISRAPFLSLTCVEYIPLQRLFYDDGSDAIGPASVHARRSASTFTCCCQYACAERKRSRIRKARLVVHGW